MPIGISLSKVKEILSLYNLPDLEDREWSVSLNKDILNTTSYFPGLSYMNHVDLIYVMLLSKNNLQYREGLQFFFVCVPWDLNPQSFQCSCNAPRPKLWYLLQMSTFSFNSFNWCAYQKQFRVNVLPRNTTGKYITSVGVFVLELCVHWS